MVIKIGTRLFNTGDVANLPCTGTVTEVKETRFGPTLKVQWDVAPGGAEVVGFIEPHMIGPADTQYERIRLALPGEYRELPAEPYEPDLTNCD